MSEEKSDFHKYCEGLDIDGFPIEETELMRKYAEAHGFGELRLTKLTDEQLKKWKAMKEREPAHIHIEMDSPVRPLPCVRVGRKAIKNCTDKEHFAKIDEEINELKEAVILYSSSDYWNLECIAEEAADTITAITTMLEAFGIDAEMRDEAQRRVNERNRERGRL